MKTKSKISRKLFYTLFSLKFIIKLLILFSIYGCESKSGKAGENEYGFQKMENIVSIRLNSSEEINKATSLYLFESMLFVSDTDKEYQFKIIDIQHDQLITSFGRNGEGPCEVAFPVGINWVNSDMRQISLNDRSRFRMESYDLDDIQTSEKPDCQQVTHNLNVNYQVIAQIDAERYVGTGLFRGRYAIQLSGQEEVLESDIGFPDDEENKNVSYETLAMAYQGRFLKHPNQNKFVSTSRNAFSLDIIEVSEENVITLIKRIHHWGPTFTGSSGNVISAAMKKGNRFGCLDAAISNDHIYILFSGKSNLQEGSQDSHIVFVYDWNGNPVKSLNLDQQISKIAVDQYDQALIGFINSRIPTLVKYDL